MTTPLPLPVRVLVKGASTVVAKSEWGGPREDFTFPRAVEAALLEAGRPADVRTVGKASQRAKTTLRTWESEILAWSPDVVVLVYGHYESIHYVLPWWLERHANSLRRRPGLVREAYRKYLLRPGWMALARLQSRLDKRFNSTLFRSRPRRVAADLERLIERCQSVDSPLVLLLDLLPPGPRARSWFPASTIPTCGSSTSATSSRATCHRVRSRRRTGSTTPRRCIARSAANSARRS
jgi:hypothetical protein